MTDDPLEQGWLEFRNRLTFSDEWRDDDETAEQVVRLAYLSGAAIIISMVRSGELTPDVADVLSERRLTGVGKALLQII